MAYIDKANSLLLFFLEHVFSAEEAVAESKSHSLTNNIYWVEPSYFRSISECILFSQIVVVGHCDCYLIGAFTLLYTIRIKLS